MDDGELYTFLVTTSNGQCVWERGFNLRFRGHCLHQRHVDEPLFIQMGGEVQLQDWGRSGPKVLLDGL